MKKLNCLLGVVACFPLSLHAAQSLDMAACKVNVKYSALQEPSGALSLSRAFDQALSLNPELGVLRFEEEAWQGNIQQAGAHPNPELTILLQDTQKSTQTRLFQVNQRLELGGKQSARIDVANQNHKISLADIAEMCAAIKIKVQGSFYDAYGAEQRYKLAQSALDLAKKVHAIAKKRVLAGKASPVEETKAQLAEAATRIELAQADGEWMLARQRLAALWGSTSPKFDSVKDSDTVLNIPLSLDPLFEQISYSPKLIKLTLEIDRYQGIVRLEQSRQVPDIMFNVGMQYDETLRRNQAVLGVMVPIPVFDRNQGALREALSRLDKVRAEKRAMEIKIKTEIAQAYGHLLTLKNTVNVLQREILPNAKNTYYLATKGFELGKFSFLDVLDAQRTLFQAQSQYIKIQADMFQKITELNQLIGSVNLTQIEGASHD